MLKTNFWRIAIVALAIMLLASAILVRLGQAQRSSAQPRPVTAQPNGRWQVINPAPQLSMNVMLLDTQTGRAWKLCTVDKKDSWCANINQDIGELVKKGLPSASNKHLMVSV